jgi:TPR repeat protein
MLQRAAEAADARAAFALAATYDPIVLGDSGVQGVTPDAAMAKAWYERARAFGSPEAPRRLELLASRAH